MNRQATASPLVATIISLGLVLSGWYVLTHGDGVTAQLGWALVVVGVLGAIGNALMFFLSRR